MRYAKSALVFASPSPTYRATQKFRGARSNPFGTRVARPTSTQTSAPFQPSWADTAIDRAHAPRAPTKPGVTSTPLSVHMLQHVQRPDPIVTVSSWGKTVSRNNSRTR